MSTKAYTKTNSRTKKINGKKVCSEGYNCPYKHEYQHGLEFTHESTTTNDTSISKPFAGKGRTLNSDNKRKHNSDKFPGPSYKLTNQNNDNNDNNDDNDNNKKKRVKKTMDNNNKNVINIIDDDDNKNINNKKKNNDNNNDNNDNNDDKIPCDICNALISFSSYNDHISTHTIL